MTSQGSIHKHSEYLKPLMDQLWQEFEKEYIPRLHELGLTQRKNQEEIKEGDVVYLITTPHSIDGTSKSFPGITHSVLGRYKVATPC